MSVELIATKLAQASGSFSPQHVNNWTLEVFGVNGDQDLSLSLGRGFLPDIASDEVEIPYANEKVYVAGRVAWSAGTITYRDFVDRDTQGLLVLWFSQVYGGVLDPNAGDIGVPARYKKDAYIMLWDPSGNSIRTWRLIGCWPRRINFGSLDQSGNDIVQPEVELRYDKAVYVGRTANMESNIVQGA